ncbi:MAG: methyl-accepting chemotaxis protein [Leptolyngbya sp.]|nr:methyl-accepting chemotaxis protein [Leptolyngbya sp.]
MEGRKIWKLRHWIIFGYSVPVAALIISAGVTVVNVRQLTQISEELGRTWEVKALIADLAIESQSLSRTARGYMMDQGQTSLDGFNASHDAINESIATLDELVKDEQQQQYLSEVSGLLQQLADTNRRLIEIASSQGTEAAIQAWKTQDGRTLSNEVADLLGVMETLENEIVDLDEELEQSALARLQFTLLTAATLSVILSAIIGTWIVLKASRMMNQAAGDIASSASEIAASVEQQERTSSQQAASVSETTTTMDELGASSRQSSEQAEAAASGAQQALKLAEGGTRAVERSLDGMTALREKVDAIADQILRLSEQTSQIGGISGLVSDLANQTNMLALNAAVEAVRAGEHGKGFAVVSGEIRKLADQSKKSAEKINALVADIQTAINSTVMVTDEGTKTVEEGVKIAEETSDAFAGVADAVNNVVLNSQQISLNVKQQAVAIQQVVSAMNSLNTGAQETANGISQIKIGTHQLNESALQLKTAI